MAIQGDSVLRACRATLDRLARTNPVVAVVGPRQAGKTTLVRRAFPDRPYENLEDPQTRAFAIEDARGFLDRLRDGAVIDEIQRVPELMSWLQVEVDEDPRPGRFVITGSAQLDLRAGVSQSLAGRVAFLRLLPFSHAELDAAGRAAASIEDAMFRGGYPPIYDRDADPRQWYGDYVATYVERDVRQLVDVSDLRTFQRFVALCAANVGQLLNLTRIAADTGITANTARRWLDVLDATFVTTLLRPHHENFRKRLVKTPKLYFLDTGLAARLLGIESAAQLLAHPLRGALFENWVVSELTKGRFNRGRGDDLWFWRNHTGEEIDVLVDRGGTLMPIECKSGHTIGADWLDGLRRFEALAGARSEPGVVVYGGGQAQTRGEHRIVPWSQIDALGRDL